MSHPHFGEVVDYAISLPSACMHEIYSGSPVCVRMQGGSDDITCTIYTFVDMAACW